MKISKGNKAKLIQRFKQEEVEEPEDFSFLDVVQPEPEPEVQEELEPEGLEQEVLEALYTEGYNGFLHGLTLEACPVQQFEDEDEQNREIAQSVWEQGWMTALQDYNTAQVILNARALVSILTKDDITEEEESFIDILIEEIAESVDSLGEVIDFDAYEEYWEKASLS